MNCSIARALEVLGEWWTLLVIREAFRGVRRFEGFVERLGIAPNILSARLQKLVDHEILELRRYCERPERFEYRLTAKGRDLFDIVVAFMQWGDRWYADAGPPARLVHLRCGRPTKPHFVCSHCGEPIEARDTRAILGPGAVEEAASLVAP